MLLKSGKYTHSGDLGSRELFSHIPEAFPCHCPGAELLQSLLGLLHVERQLGEHMEAQPKPGFNSDLPHPGWVPTSTEMLLCSRFLSALILGGKGICCSDSTNK